MKDLLYIILLLFIISVSSYAKDRDYNFWGKWESTIANEKSITIQELESRKSNNYIIISNDIYALSCLKVSETHSNSHLLCCPAILYKANFNVKSHIRDVVEQGNTAKSKNYFFNISNNQLVIKEAPLDQCHSKNSKCEKRVWGKYIKVDNN